MAESTGEEAAAVLLRTLPTDVSELVLARLGPAGAAVRARLGGPAPTDQELDVALAHFFDLQRIADRLPVEVAESVPAEKPKSTATPIEQIRALAPEQLARALAGEPPSAVAQILGCVGSLVAGQVLKRLPADMRADVAVRLSRPAQPNPILLERLARAVTEKGRRLADAPPEQTAADRVNMLAELLRALPRADRTPVLQRLEAADATLATSVRDLLYRIEDLKRIPDRQLQTLLTELEAKKLAIALKGVDDAVRDKVTKNMSSRARAVLAEESELLGELPASAVREARSELLAVVRRLEEEGRIVIEE